MKGFPVRRLGEAPSYMKLGEPQEKGGTLKELGTLVSPRQAQTTGV